MERKGCMDGDRQREREDGYSGCLVVLIWFLNTIPAPGMQAWGLRNPNLADPSVYSGEKLLPLGN